MNNNKIFQSILSVFSFGMINYNKEKVYDTNSIDRPFVPLFINNIPLRFLADTGAHHSVLSSKLFDKIKDCPMIIKLNLDHLLDSKVLMAPI